jgi:hypothetical protein
MLDGYNVSAYMSAHYVPTSLVSTADFFQDFFYEVL